MKLRLIALAAFMFSLTSCFDVYETFNISEKGSGTYEIKMDMSQLIAMSKMMGKGANSNKAPEKKDSTIYISSVTDTASALTAAEKAVFKKAFASIHVDEEAMEMWVKINFPYASEKEFALMQDVLAKGEKAKTVFGAIDKIMGDAKKSPMGGDDEMIENAGGGGMPTKDFSYILTAGSLERKMNPLAIKKPKTEDEEMPDQLKGMFQMNFTTIINLPRPVKNWKGNNGTLSDDKKQLKFNKAVDMGTDLTSEEFAFSIEY